MTLSQIRKISLLLIILTSSFTNERNLQQDYFASYQLPEDEDDLKRDSFYYARNITCTSENCGLPNALCNTEKTTCACFPGFVNNITEEGEDPRYLSKFCTYPQKKQLTAFLLEVFLGNFAAGHLYIRQLNIGLPKLFVFNFACIFMGCFYSCCKDSDTLRTILIIFCVILCLGIFAWSILDLVFFGTNRYYDNHGKPLEPW